MSTVVVQIMTIVSRSRSLLLKTEIQLQLNKLNLLWPFDSKLKVWVTYIKRQLGIVTQMSVIKVTVAKNEIQFPPNNLSLLWPIDAKLRI
jgi:hypothetical protein